MATQSTESIGLLFYVAACVTSFLHVMPFVCMEDQEHIDLTRKLSTSMCSIAGKHLLFQVLSQDGVQPLISVKSKPKLSDVLCNIPPWGGGYSILGHAWYGGSAVMIPDFGIFNPIGSFIYTSTQFD